MKIDIVPVVEIADGAQSDFKSDCAPSAASAVVAVCPLENKSAKPTSITSQSINVELDKIFAEFLELEVGDGAASTDTIRNYISHTKQYFNWCKDNLYQFKLNI